MLRTGSVSKKVFFEKEQKEILNKILELFGVNKENKTFTLYEISKKPDVIKSILELKQDIAKYFSAGKWVCFKDPNYNSDKEHVVLLRNILKTLDIKFFVETYKFLIDTDTYAFTRKYTVDL